MAADWTVLVPAWATAIAAAGAVVVAFTVFRNDLSERQRTERERQARLFDVWVASAEWTRINEAGQPSQDFLAIGLRVSNESGQSVRGVDAGMSYMGHQLPVLMLGVIGPTMRDFHGARVTNFEASRFPGQLVSQGYNMDPHFARRGVALSYSFTDASGNRWHRTDEGELRFLYNLTQRRREVNEGGRLARFARWIGWGQ